MCGAHVVDTKEKLTNWLSSIQNSFMVGMAAVFLFEQEDVWPLLKDAELGFVPEGAAFSPENMSIRLPIHLVGERMQQEGLRPLLLKDFREYLLRNTLSETLEHTREYCEATSQMAKLNSAPWYHFARVIRNALTHDSRVRFDRLARPPLAFDRWRIESAHAGKHIADIGLASTATVPLIVAIQEFVEQELT